MLSHFTRIADLGPQGVAATLALAREYKASDPGAIFSGKLLGMLFYNPSLRTRASFEASMLRHGGHAIVLDVAGSWKLEHRTGVVMDGDCAEHVREAVPVLCRYVDALAVRTFAALRDGDADESDPVLNAFRDNATVPVINMESAREHPCQGIADVLTIEEKLGALKRRRVTLTWVPHIKPHPLAVPHSFLLSSAACGCDVTVAHPPGFDLHSRVVAQAQAYGAETGGSIRFTHDQREACADAEVVYAKHWAPMSLMPDTAKATALIREYAAWMLTLATLRCGGESPLFMHCLPVRRNLVVADDVLDSALSIVIDQAENRLHAQRAVLARIFGAA
jgi:N-acetylornithine carbamoyltransferase